MRMALVMKCSPSYSQKGGLVLQAKCLRTGSNIDNTIDDCNWNIFFSFFFSTSDQLEIQHHKSNQLNKGSHHLRSSQFK